MTRGYFFFVASVLSCFEQSLIFIHSTIDAPNTRMNNETMLYEITDS